MIYRYQNNLQKPSGPVHTVNWGHPLWHRTRGMWLFNLPYAPSSGYDLVTGNGMITTAGAASGAMGRIGIGVGLNVAAKVPLNHIRTIQNSGAGSAHRSLSQAGTYMPTDSVTIALIRQKANRTALTGGPIGLHDSTTGNRCGCNMTGHGAFNWQFGGTDATHSIQASGAFFSNANTQTNSFSTITLGANSSLAGWYFLASATNNFNPIWSKDSNNEVYYGSGASAGKVAVVKGGVTIAQSTGTVSQNVWQHLLITDDGSAIKIYLDGADIGNSVGYTTMSGLQFTRLNQGVNSNNFFGRYCQQAIWSAALSGSDATTLYNGGYGIRSDVAVAPFNANLVALWNGDSATDLSGNGNTLTIATSTGPSRLAKDFDAMSTNVQYLVYTAGKRGSAIYGDGRKIGFSSTAISRTDADSEFLLNENANSTGEDQTVYFAAVLDTEWTEDQVMWWYQDPWSGVLPKRRWEVLAAAGAAPSGNPWLHYAQQMRG